VAYTAEQLEALQSALATGELTVEYEGRRVTYRSIAELERAIATVSAALTAETAPTRPRQVRVAGSRKGWG
jgi:hypothetical protein